MRWHDPMLSDATGGIGVRRNRHFPDDSRLGDTCARVGIVAEPSSIDPGPWGLLMDELQPYITSDAGPGLWRFERAPSASLRNGLANLTDNLLQEHANAGPSWWQVVRATESVESLQVSGYVARRDGDVGVWIDTVVARWGERDHVARMLPIARADEGPSIDRPPPDRDDQLVSWWWD